MLSIIVAIAKNNVIGKDNKLIWHLPEDLKNFKRLTINHNIIMGRKTFESLGKILPNRKHIVFSRNLEFISKDKNVEIVHNISEIEKYINSSEETFVIGGEKIYSLLLPYVQRMYITQIYEEFQGDSYFPNFNKNEWKIVSKQKGIRDEKNNYNYEFIVYEKNFKNIKKSVDKLNLKC